MVGTGNLGRRHLQGLLSMRQPSNLVAVDPSCDNLKLAEETVAATEFDAPHRVSYLRSLDELEFSPQLAVVATTASHREAVTCELLQKGTRIFILEKILFQSQGALERVGQELKQSSARAWVNCPRRLYDPYIRLRNAVGSGPLSLSVRGGAWGLGCNGIHYLDLFAFLTGQSELSLNTECLDKELSPSKRVGHYEFTGTLSGYSRDGGQLSLSSYQNSDLPFMVSLEGPEVRATIREGYDGTGLFEVSFSSTGWESETWSHKFPFQSELTGGLAEELLDTGSCGLTSYPESSKLHRALLGGFVEHLRRLGKDEDECRIT